MESQARILVVDDIPANVRVLTKILDSHGYKVDTAAGGKEALDKIATNRPEIVLLDVMMPDMSGYEVCRTIRADPTTAILPVVLVTALDDSDEQVAGGRLKRLEPARLPGPDPAVQALPRVTDRPAERTLMLGRGQRPHQLAALLAGQRRISGLADQGVAEQSDVAGPAGPAVNLTFVLGHRRLQLVVTTRRDHHRRGCRAGGALPRVNSC